jgi:enterochelin esterase-like enzyme
MTGVGVPGFATAAHASFVIAAPGGGDATYWHPRADGRDPMDYLVDEFIPYVEDRWGCGGHRDNRLMLGWSMGGFGALLVAQQNPDLLGRVAAMSPAVFPSYDAARSGHSYTFDSAADWEQYGVWNHLEEVGATSVRIDCGSADPFAPTARELLKRIPAAVGGISSGCHDKGFWRRKMPTVLRFLAASRS